MPHRALISFMISLAFLAMTAAPSSAETPVDVFTNLQKTTVVGNSLINASGERAYSMVVAVQYPSGASELYLRLCIEKTSECNEHFKTLNSDEYLLSDGGTAYIVTTVDGIGKVNLRVVADGGGLEPIPCPSVGTQSIALVVGARVDNAGTSLSYPSAIGEWSVSWESPCGAHGWNAQVVWART